MMRFDSIARIFSFILIHVAAAFLSGSQAMALETFDFEARYFVHEGKQIWDFCLTPNDDHYNIFYHTLSPEVDQHA